MLLTQTRSPASSGSFQIYGYIHDSASNPIVDIDVIGDDYVGDYYIFKSDHTGFYSVDVITDGNYRVVVDCAELTARGYNCIQPVAVSLTGDAIQVDFVVHRVDVGMQITNATLPRGNVGAAYNVQLGVNGGQPPYHWKLAADSPTLPSGLSLTSEGLISGTPMTFIAANIKVEVTDHGGAATNKVLGLTINPRPVLTTPVWVTNRFTMRLLGAPNQNYTIQSSADFTNWTSLFVTNNPDIGSYTVRDPSATNTSRFYRVLVGP